MDISEILEKYKSGEITREEANTKLKEADSNFSLKALTDEERTLKQKREDREGYIPAETTPVYPDRPNMKRNPALAGQVVEQITKQGKFAVTYNENGYAVSARRVR